MKIKAHVLKGGLLLLTCVLGARAQSADLQTARMERTMQQEMAAAVAQGVITPQAALAAMNGKDVAGQRPAAEAAYAALDMALRLKIARRPEEARVFFEAAEAGLQRVVNQLPDNQAEEKSGHLQNLARIRADHLNKPSQAQADVEQALRLRPADKRGLGLQRQLAVQRGDQAALVQLAQRAKEAAK